jgi:hypothetical protein
MLNNIVTPDSGSTILFNIVDKCEQCGQQNMFNPVVVELEIPPSGSFSKRSRDCFL